MWIALLLTMIAVGYDLKSFKIPNGLTWGGIIAGLCLAGLGGPSVLLDALGGALLPICLLWIPCRLRMIGAGDLKLLGMCGAFGGTGKSLQLLGFSFAVGAVIALTTMLRRGNAAERFSYLAEYLKRGLQTGRWPSYLEGSCQDGVRIHFSVPILIGQAICCLLLVA
ncbi:MAG: A24 family peptidase [Lachnospiraceae bacterium]|nr:A24 family peptidase [Lachnospiraceae bacterium]